jgi:hypothetical protein
MMKHTFCPVFLLAFLLTGCANWQTVYRNEDSAGKTIAIDATQRVVVSTVSQTGDGKTVTRFCPEPSPDAIAAFAASMGLGASAPARGATVDANLQYAAASQVAAIGLRTPTTQVIRDLITAACIAHMNDAFKDPGFREAFERNQDFVLAAHAIAVIGGEPVARQFLLNANAGAGANSTDARAAYVDFKNAQAARIKAESDLAEAKGAKEAASKESDTANTALTAAKAKVPKDDAAIAAAQKAVDEKSAALAAATKAEEDATKKVADAKVAEKNAQSTLNVIGAGQLSTGGTGAEASAASLGRASATVNLSNTAIKTIGNIVTTTLISGFSLERCINHLVAISKLDVKDDVRTRLTNSVSQLCSSNADAAKAEAEVRKQQAVRALQVQ